MEAVRTNAYEAKFYKDISQWVAVSLVTTLAHNFFFQFKPRLLTCRCHGIVESLTLNKSAFAFACASLASKISSSVLLVFPEAYSKVPVLVTYFNYVSRVNCISKIFQLSKWNLPSLDISTGLLTKALRETSTR